MPYRGQVHSDLVGAPGLQRHTQERRVGQQTLDLEMRPRGSWLVGIDRHQRSIAPMTADRGVDRAAARRGMAVDQSRILPPKQSS
jgi:hypothetical protein